MDLRQDEVWWIQGGSTRPITRKRRAMSRPRPHQGSQASRRSDLSRCRIAAGPNPRSCPMISPSPRVEEVQAAAGEDVHGPPALVEEAG